MTFSSKYIIVWLYRPLTTSAPIYTLFPNGQFSFICGHVPYSVIGLGWRLQEAIKVQSPLSRDWRSGSWVWRMRVCLMIPNRPWCCYYWWMSQQSELENLMYSKVSRSGEEYMMCQRTQQKQKLITGVLELNTNTRSSNGRELKSIMAITCDWWAHDWSTSDYRTQEEDNRGETSKRKS